MHKLDDVSSEGATCMHAQVGPKVISRPNIRAQNSSLNQS